MLFVTLYTPFAPPPKERSTGPAHPMTRHLDIKDHLLGIHVRSDSSFFIMILAIVIIWGFLIRKLFVKFTF